MQLQPPSSIGWLFLDLNSYFASVEQQLQPQLRGKPIAIVPLETDATCAIAASYEAKAFGIKTGTPIYEAKKMCPELICVLANHENYVEFHHKIIAEVEQHIPVSDIASIDEMACELDISQRNPAVAIRLAKQIKRGLHQNVGEAINCSIGLAPNRFLAKLGTELQKPDGLVVIEPQDIPHKLMSLNFGNIAGIGRAMQHRLAKVGVHTVEQLYQLDAKQMRAIWHSVEGERLFYRLRGIEIAKEETQKRVIGHSHVLAPENRPAIEAQRVSQRLLLKAASRMRRQHYYATRLTVGIRIENGEKYKAETNFQPSCDNQKLAQAWQNMWKKALAQSPYAAPRIKKISVNLHGLVEAAQVQPDLFDEQPLKKSQYKNEKLSQTMDALNTRFGRNTITTAATLGDANNQTGTKIAFTRIPDIEEFAE